MSVAAALARRNRAYPDPSLTPAGFALTYYQCGVVLRDGSVGNVIVHKYRINDNDPDNVDPSTRIRDHTADRERYVVGGALREWCRRNDALGRDVLRLLFRERKLNQVYFGKGAPRDISLVLTILNECGRITERFPNVNERVALQKYCDEYVGVDCSGFVNNYFIATGHFRDTNDNCQTLISQYGQRQRRLDFLPDNPRKFILVWPSLKHIAIIEQWWLFHWYLLVVESSASLGGIVITSYKVDPDYPDLSVPPGRRHWRTYRLAQARRRMHVYMVPPMPAR